MIPTNTLRGIYANQPAASAKPPAYETQELDTLDGRSLQTGPHPSDPGQHTKGDFVLGRSAIIAIIVVSVVLIVLIVVVVVKAGQIAKKNEREKKKKQEAAGIVSAAVRSWAGPKGVVGVLLGVLVQVVLL